MYGLTYKQTTNLCKSFELLDLMKFVVITYGRPHLHFHDNPSLILSFYFRFLLIDRSEDMTKQERRSEKEREKIKSAKLSPAR